MKSAGFNVPTQIVTFDYGLAKEAILPDDEHLSDEDLVSDRVCSRVPFKEQSFEDEGIKSAKWLVWWALLLDQRRARALLEGLRFADGTEAQNINSILTSSARFRDQVVQLLVHAGYSARFGVTQIPGMLAGVVWHADATSPQGESADPIYARQVGWSITYSEVRAQCRSGTTRQSFAAEPTLKKIADCDGMITEDSDIQTTKYTGRTWGVMIPKKRSYVVVRRAHRVDSVVTKASVPTIQGSCTDQQR